MIVAENEDNLQAMITNMHQWCRRWRLTVNPKKSNVAHFRKKTKPRSNFKILFVEPQLEYASKYKYLGMYLSEFLDFSVTVSVLADASCSALGGIIDNI